MEFGCFDLGRGALPDDHIPDSAKVLAKIGSGFERGYLFNMVESEFKPLTHWPEALDCDWNNINKKISEFSQNLEVDHWGKFDALPDALQNFLIEGYEFCGLKFRISKHNM